MHTVDPWQVLFLVIMMLATGGAVGFSMGVEYVRRRRRRDDAAQFDPGDRVTFGDGSYAYEGCALDAVFSTRELADQYAALMSKDSCANWEVKEVIVDDPRDLDTLTKGVTRG